MKWLLTAAVLLAAGMIATGAVAGRILRERDAAVREGVLTRASHELERELRDQGPDLAATLLPSFLARHGEVSGAEVAADGRTLIAAGTLSGNVVETPAALGPGWRHLSGGMGMRQGRSPYTIRLAPSSRLGDASAIAFAVTWGSAAAALALLAFAIAAARGLEARQRATALEAENRRFETTALAGAGLAHRIRNPLATIKATAQMLSPAVEAPLRERADRIVDASRRIESLVDELLEFARPAEPRPVPFDIAELARQIAGVAAVEGEQHLLVRADREHATAAIEELISNAAAFDSAPPSVAVSRRGRMAAVEIRDRGPGLEIDPPRAFDPYVTTRADGTGLGLPTVAALARANNGEVTLANRAGGGCVATLLLPLEETR